MSHASNGSRTNTLGVALERFARFATVWTGSTWGFMFALLAIVLWLVSGPFFHYSDTWQLVINTATTVITFVMVFLIQRAQNKESLAMQIKLNEILAALKGASNRLINIEDLGEEDIQRLHDRYQKLAERVRREGDVRGTHSIDEARQRRGRVHATPAERAEGPRGGLEPPPSR